MILVIPQQLRRPYRDVMAPTAHSTGKSWFDLLGRNLVAERTLRPGDAVFRQGTPATAIYRVEAGRVRLVRHLKDGSSVVLHVARAAATFAEAALFSDRYHCDAVADGATRLSVIPKAELLAALRADPVACLDFARGLADQVRDLRAQLEVRNIRSAGERLLGWLRLTARGNRLAVEVDRPWTEIAAEIGLTHETIYRSLAELERTGQLVRNGRRILLVEPPRPIPTEL